MGFLQTSVFIVAIVAIVVYVVIIPDTPISGKDKILLGSGGYDITPLQAPVMKGKALEIFAHVFSQSRLGPFIKRTLLNQNKLSTLRELASQIETAPMYFPIYRMNKAEMQRNDELASIPETSVEHVQQHGLGQGDVHSRATVTQYAATYRNGDVKPSEVMARAIAAVREWEKEGFLIFSSLLESDVMQQARESDARHAAGAPLSILDGVPIAFKDSIEITDHPMFDGMHPSIPVIEKGVKDDLIVARFRSLGAIIFGMTLMTEGGTSPLGFNPHFQGPVNAYSLNHYSGGSSSGSAVAVASGLVPIAIGFDGGGSIRLPASLSGLHGLAVSWGRIPFFPTYSTVTKAGPLAVSAADAAIAFAVMAPNEEGHPLTELYDGGVHGPPTPHLSGFNDVQDLSDVRLGIFDDWFNDSDPAVRAACHSAVSYLVSRGATVVPIAIPHLQWLSLAHAMKIASEFAGRFDLNLWTNGHKLDPNAKVTVGVGSTVTALEVLSGEVLRGYAFRHVRKLFTDLNLTAIVTPTNPMVAPSLADDAREIGETNSPLAVKIMKYVFLANFLGLPGYSVPVGFVESAETPGVHLPVGLQLIGAHWQEHALLRVAHSLEQGHSAHLPAETPKFSFKPF